MTNNNIKVSIIVPIYNVEPYLKKCLNSLVNQTIANDIEIICINDCSPDNCLNILKEYQENYGNRLIKIIDHKENKGVAISRNDGLAIAQGEYLGFVDPDDWVDLNFFEALYNSGVETGADMVRGNAKRVSGSMVRIVNKNPEIRKNNYAIIENGWCFSIYKNEVVKKNDIDFINTTCGEDNYFLLKFYFNSKKLEIVDNVFYYYFDRPGSYTKSYSNERMISAINYIKASTSFINSIEIPVDAYLFFFNCRINELVYYFFRTVNLMIADNIVNTIFMLYFDCKYKDKYIEKYGSYWSNFLINNDFIGLKKYLQDKCYIKKSIKIFKYFTFLKIKYKQDKKYFYLFNFILILKINTEKIFKRKYSIFGFIPLLTITRQ